MKKLINNKQGAIALVAVLVISAILIIISLGISDAQISNSLQYKNNYNDKTLYYFAETCLEEAMIRIERDPNFSSGSIDNGDGVACTITASGSSIKDLNVVVTFQNFSQNYLGNISITQNGQANNVSLLKWEKIN